MITNEWVESTQRSQQLDFLHAKYIESLWSLELKFFISRAAED